MKTLLNVLLTALAAALPLAGPNAAARAQAPAWQTAVALTQTGGQGIASVNSTATDAGGNVLLAGSFDGTMTLGTTTLTSAGNYDGFVAKWSPAAQSFVWARRLGGPGRDFAETIAVSGTSLYVGGNFEGTASFGGLNAAASGASDAYVAKLTDAGPAAAFVWVERAGGLAPTDGAYVKQLAVNGTAVYAVGSFEGSLVAGTTLLSSPGNANGFVFRLDDAGPAAAPAWAQDLGGSLDETVFGVAVEGSSVYVVGLFAGTTNMGPFSLTSAGADDGFLVKLTDAGAAPTVTWARAVGSSADDGLTAVAVRGSSVYVAGAFSNTVTLGTTTLVSAGDVDALVMKLLDSGPAATVAWATRGGGPDQDVPYSLTPAGNNLYISGFFVGPATYGPSALGGSSAGNDDIFVARVVDAGTTGSFAWAQEASSATGNDYGNSVTVSGGRVYVGGTTNLPATFGALALTGAPGDADFLAALADPVLGTAAPRRFAAATLAPNPASRETTLRLPARAAPATLTVIDGLGRVVRTQPVAAGAAAVPVPLAGLPAGLYHVQVAGGGAPVSQVLSIE